MSICSLASNNILEVKSMHRPGTEAIRTKIQPLKPKREITKITKRIYGQPSNFQEVGHSETQIELNII